ncbi:helix-turn-helix domain-containing protein [Ideonella sp. B7]|uniref:helix-turn-helix domain-containing protein n=1 Tax=Ideonella benzenivorans TaxID=2831643 RepID=UPI001CEC4EC1|nr:helix-turn-helix domain-containing protein [Ideonella benzenivorans]MCA6215805.1 helix-turn-helix domain-containing protein [Ideonella benzenivorans]
MTSASESPGVSAYTTQEAARLLGLAVRSVQLMVDRGELQAWKTPGGHRRIDPASVAAWQARQQGTLPAAAGPRGTAEAVPRALRILLIEDSVHYQNLIGLLVRRALPEAEFQVASDGIVGLAQVGQWQPDLLIVDLLLPGIDGAALIASLRSQPMFGALRLVVVTSLEEAERASFALALEGLPVVHKTALVARLPDLLAREARAVMASRA